MPTRRHDIALRQTRPATSCYEHQTLQKLLGFKTLKSITNWIVEELDIRIVLKKGLHVVLPEIQIMIDDSLGFTISVYGWLLPEDHELYSENIRSVANITVSELVKKIELMSICHGVKPSILSSEIQHHVIPKPVDPLLDDEESTSAPS